MDSLMYVRVMMSVCRRIPDYLDGVRFRLGMTRSGLRGSSVRLLCAAVLRQESLVLPTILARRLLCVRSLIQHKTVGRCAPRPSAAIATHRHKPSRFSRILTGTHPTVSVFMPLEPSTTHRVAILREIPIDRPYTRRSALPPASELAQVCITWHAFAQHTDIEKRWIR